MNTNHNQITEFYGIVHTGDLKRICETELGLISQCCVTKHVVKASRQYLANLSLKINVKVTICIHKCMDIWISLEWPTPFLNSSNEWCVTSADGRKKHSPDGCLKFKNPNGQWHTHYNLWSWCYPPWQWRGLQPIHCCSKETIPVKLKCKITSLNFRLIPQLLHRW